MLIHPDKSLVYLTGFMGSGKSTTGASLAKALTVKFFDLDGLIEQRMAKSIAHIFQDEGAAFFRVIETEVLKEVSQEKYAVVALGGGTILEPKNLELIQKTGLLICLSAEPDEIWRRVADSDKRHLLEMRGEHDKGALSLEEIYRRINFLLKIRQPYYEEADFFIDTTDKSVEEVVREILFEMEKRRFTNGKIGETN